MSRSDRASSAQRLIEVDGLVRAWVAAMADDSFSAQVWAAMHRAAQQVIDDLVARGRELDPSRIGARVASLLSDVPGVREHVPALVQELQDRLRARRLRGASRS